MEIWISILNLLATAILSLMAYCLSRKYSKASQRLNEDQMFHQLFRDFNQRYDQLNSSLFKIAKECKTIEDLNDDPQLKSDLIDFFNLCAEEYYWYKRKRIHPKVWRTWKTGMNDWYNDEPIIKKMWKEELRKYGFDAYYLKEGDNLFIDR